jgi:hypothetical protein
MPLTCGGRVGVPPSPLGFSVGALGLDTTDSELAAAE